VISFSAGEILTTEHLLFPPAAFRLCVVALRVPQRKFYNAPHLVRAIASVSVKILLRSHANVASLSPSSGGSPERRDEIIVAQRIWPRTEASGCPK
jgi:hypothetical protein